MIVSIASLIYTKSENHDCGYYSAVTDGAAYQVHATGSNCDTTAEQATIEGGLQTYFDAHGGDVCDVHCVSEELATYLPRFKGRSYHAGSANSRWNVHRLSSDRS